MELTRNYHSIKRRNRCIKRNIAFIGIADIQVAEHAGTGERNMLVKIARMIVDVNITELASIATE